MAQGYSEDLAYIHDAGFGDFSAEAAPGLLRMLRRSGVTSGLVLDLGCGSGVWARMLTQAGYDVLGIDSSARMIELARKRTRVARFRVGSFHKLSLPPCDAVTSLGECLNYRFDTTGGVSDLKRLFRRVYTALRPGGVFIFDIAEPGRGSGGRRSFKEGVDWAVLFEVEEQKRRKELTRRITTFRKVGKFYRRGQEIHRLKLYKGPETARELRRIGFRVRTLRGYGRRRFEVAHVGFLARKPQT